MAIKKEQLSSSISLGGGGGSGIEQLAQKMELEKSGLYTEALDNSIAVSGMVPYFTDTVVGRLLKDHTTGASQLEISWNPIFLNDSDRDLNITTGWSVVSAGASLTTNSSNKQIGTHSLQFDKNNTATQAGIRYDRGSQNLSLAGNNILQFYINLPSIINLSSVYARVYADTTSNFRQYTVTTDVSGTALATGWNLIRINLSNTTGTTTGGTGWNVNTLSRYVEVGVITTSATQTYTAILLDSLMFSISNPETMGILGSQVTLYNNSTKQEVIINSANTLHDTRLSLISGQTLSSNYNGGIVTASASSIERMTTVISNGVIGFNSTLTAGAISTQQEIRINRFLRETVSGTFKTITDTTTPQWARVTNVSGSTVDIEDPGNLSSNYVNTDVVHIFRPRYTTQGETQYVYIGDRTLTANSTHSSGTTTLTLNIGGVNIGDFVVKKHVTTQVSLVSANANENLVTVDPDPAPNGIQVIDNFLGYPNRQNAAFHYPMGGTNATSAFTSRIGTYTSDIFNNFTGTPTYNNAGLGGRLSYRNASGFKWRVYSSTSDVGYLLLGNGNKVQISFWMYYGKDSTTHYILTNHDNANSGYGWSFDKTGTNTVRLKLFNNGLVSQTSPISVVEGSWYHIFLHLHHGFTSYVYVNGVKYNAGTVIGWGATHEFLIGGIKASAAMSPDIFYQDMYAIIGGQELTETQILSIWNNGNYRPFETGGIRYQSTVQNLSGEKLSLKHQINRTTTAVNPSILKTGIIKI